MKIAVAGASGFIGQAVVGRFATHGHEVVRLVRSRQQDSEAVIQWHPNEGELAEGALDGFDAVICLSGETIAGRWTKRKKQAIYDSRIKSASLLAGEMSRSTQPPNVFICASAVGYYGDRDDAVLDESAPRGDGFLAEVCEDWEAAVRPAAMAGVRTVSVRWGVVLDPAGGMLKQIAPLFRAGLGGRLGNGNQYMSWIALEDVLGILEFVLQTEGIIGPVNGTSPNPVTNRAFTKALGHAVHRPTVLPVPAVAVKLALGEAGESLALTSTRAVPARLESAGYPFRHAELEPALEEMFPRG